MREPDIALGFYSSKVEKAVDSGKGFLDRLGQKGKGLVEKGVRKKR